MTNIIIFADTWYGKAVANLKDVKLEWKMLSAKDSTTPADKLPYMITEIIIYNEDGTFRQVNPLPKVKVTFMSRVKEQLRKWGGCAPRSNQVTDMLVKENERLNAQIERLHAMIQKAIR